MGFPYRVRGRLCLRRNDGCGGVGVGGIARNPAAPLGPRLRGDDGSVTLAAALVR